MSKKTFNLNTIEIFDMSDAHIVRVSFVREEPLYRLDAEFACAQNCTSTEFASFLRSIAGMVEKKITNSL